MRLYPVIFRLHKIFSVVVGIQLLLWVISGLYMTAVPISYVHGDHLKAKMDNDLIEIQYLPLVIQNTLREKNIPAIESLRLIQRMGEPAYLLESNGANLMLSASDGSMLEKLTEQQAQKIAVAAYTGSAPISSVRLIESYAEMPEIKGRDLPIWQVNFDDWVSTSLYVSNAEARVTTARSSIWRIFDFLWMLHIMDYDEREDFNNPLVIFMATAGIFMVLSGAVLLIKGLQRSGSRYFK